MSAFAKVVVFLVITFVLFAILGNVPKSEKEFLGIGTAVIFAWLLAGAFYGARGLYRFMTR